MKLFLPLLTLLSTGVASASDCGSGVTTPCLAESDIRYDAASGYDLEDQGQFWNRISGYYQGYDTKYNIVNNVPTPDSEEAAVLTYMNITVSGSRVYMHRYGFVEGEAKVQLLDTYLTSTFEKDGSVRELGRNSNEGSMGVKPFQVSDDEYEGNTFGPYTAYFMGEIGLYVGNIAQEFYTCLGTEEDASKETAPCAQLLSQKDMYVKFNEQLKFDRSRRLSAERITEESFVGSVAPRLAQFEATEALDVATDACATQECPTEEQWQTYDPYYNTSPYQEPDGSLEGWFVALIIIIVVLAVCAALYFAHRHVVMKREDRIKEAFAQSIAESISHRVKAEELTPQDLRKEFELIDEDSSGLVSKEEFHNFIMKSDKVHLDERDFDVLYRTIDTNGDGEIDFAEFCAFFSMIRGTFNSTVNKSEGATPAASKDSSPADSVTKEDEKDEGVTIVA